LGALTPNAPRGYGSALNYTQQKELTSFYNTTELINPMWRQSTFFGCSDTSRTTWFTAS